MAHTLSAQKRIRQTEKRRMRNRIYKSRMKTGIKNYLKTIEGGDVAAAEAQLTAIIKLIDKTATKGTIHKNEASRRVSRLTMKLNDLKAQA